MAAIPKSVGHGDGEHHKSAGRGSIEMGEAINRHQVRSIHNACNLLTDYSVY